MKIYKVGGAIRDSLLEVEASDNDWVVVGSSPEEMIANGFKPIGKIFLYFFIQKLMKNMLWQEQKENLAPVIMVSHFILERMLVLKMIYPEEISPSTQ